MDDPTGLSLHHSLPLSSVLRRGSDRQGSRPYSSHEGWGSVVPPFKRFLLRVVLVYSHGTGSPISLLVSVTPSRYSNGIPNRNTPIYLHGRHSTLDGSLRLSSTQSLNPGVTFTLHYRLLLWCPQQLRNQSFTCRLDRLRRPGQPHGPHCLF